MLGRASFLTTIVLAAVLGGCIGGDNDAPETTDTDSVNQTNTLPENATVAPDGRGDISAFKETNKTEMGTGGMHHAHDYWGGKERLDDVAWIDAGLIPFPVFPCKKADGSCTVGGSGETYPAGTAIADFDLEPPPTMGMIYEGTKQVEVKLAKFTGPEGGPANPAGKVYFDYLAANDEPGAFRPGGELKLNEPFIIEIEPTDADMPHQTKSLWVFRIYSNTEMVWFEFNITISLVKGYDVVDWPPHPDLYADKPERLVHEGPVKLSSKGTIDSNVYGTDAGWFHPDKVISWGTDRVEVTISNIQFVSDVPTAKPVGYVLEYHNASKPPLLGHGTQFGARLTDPSSDGTSYSFTIDLTSDRGDAYDTPYAQYSRWGFRFVPKWGEDDSATCPSSVKSPTGRDYGPFLQQFLVGCQWYPWSISYDMKIVAAGHSTANGAPEAVG